MEPDRQASVRSPVRLEDLLRLTPQQLVGWILTALSGGDHGLETAERDPDQVLLLVWRNEAPGEKVREALACAFDSLAPVVENAATIYYALQAISVIRPPSCQRMLQLRLSQGDFQDLSFGHSNLDQLALSVLCAAYLITDDTLDLIFRTSHLHPEPHVALLCFRLIAKRDVSLALSFLEKNLQYLSTPGFDRRLARVFRGLLWRSGAKRIYAWWIDVETRLSGEPALATLTATLRDRVFPWPNSRQGRDPYATLLSAWLHAGHIPFVAQEIVGIAKLMHEPALYEHPDAPQKILDRIFQESEKHAVHWGKEPPLGPNIGRCEPWDGRLEEDGFVVETFWREDVLAERGVHAGDLDRVELSLHDLVVPTTIMVAAKPWPSLAYEPGEAASLERFDE